MAQRTARRYPIAHWSYSSLITYLRNPLAWHKRYVEKVYDMPSSPASVVGRAAHVALQHFYGGFPKEAAIDMGLAFLKNVPDFEINFGKKGRTKVGRKAKRAQMEVEYIRAVSFYLAKPPKHRVLGVEVKATAQVPGIPIPVKAISDLVIESRGNAGMVDIVDHKFVEAFGLLDIENPLYMLQALFNYYTVVSEFKRPVKRFLVYECKKTKNKDGKPQLRRHVIDFQKHASEFELFHRLLKEATEDIATRTKFLPNPSDMLEGKNSLEIYRWGLAEENENAPRVSGAFSEEIE